mmetsp:Transcript_11058/g.19163  ORF Transcript_11058/g.19163 Transcript_11058/m.19163 type:complete len:214 (+) Transcript_11058:106-747(+)|eukprot:CAMPEP_0119108322 /NCGR_PEP_ID=MMETSP1180-20130426/13710_1 /TAXON_ID=3052 ORGANISM="Chlamydomonas cf sp, Strain CCMP681" /NCGR_SAMPLE_ID=MMETSP1180 /ASSEMBLY_ACC=CAM_ASM_000741 /LENGTH=213 /DNA_ID=CAMNT_0007093923 /DNA_START=110 /DNA_END=751 /DNA_ORIENTATION=-
MQTNASLKQVARPGVLASRPCRAFVVTRAAAFQGTVRPYTLRKGDTLDTIAKKRALTVEQLAALNPGMNPAKMEAGKTILIPSAKLSSRDREILDGIGAGYRLYPVRMGETLPDIMAKRKITMSEMHSLNPGINLDQLEDNQILKLPAGKFTVREREMLIGSGIVPSEFFEVAKNPFVIGVGALLGVCGFVLAWMNLQTDDELDAGRQTKTKA